MPWMLGSFLIPAIQERCRQDRENAVKGNKVDQITGKPAYVRKRWEDWVCPPWKKEDEWTLYHAPAWKVCLQRWKLVFLKKSYGKGDGYKFFLRRLRLNIRKIFTMRTNSHWNNLSIVGSRFPKAGHFWDSAGQGSGSSCLYCAFANKGWTRR